MALLLLPNQLFPAEIIFPLNPSQIIFLEDPLFFEDSERSLNFNRLKLVFQRASFRLHSQKLKEAGFSVTYLEFNPSYSKLYAKIPKASSYLIFDPIDHLFEARIRSVLPNLSFLDNPSFIATNEMLERYVGSTSNPFFQTTFYSFMRKETGILMDKGKPVGGKLTYDIENRQPFSKALPILEGMREEELNPYVQHSKEEERAIDEAIDYVEKKFVKHPGRPFSELKSFLLAPLTRETALAQMEKFILDRADNFGPFEDAFSKDYYFLFHSVISSSLNLGIIFPQECISMMVEGYQRKKVSLSSTEGFVRQILGWREFSRLMYLYKYEQMVSSNSLNAQRKLNSKFYLYADDKKNTFEYGGTGVEPVDDAILIAWSFGYLHHILRLMVMANFMTLTGIEPNQVYQWFMDFSLDSYDWVMIFNVYSMGTYADPSFTTKPYISSSNYLSKMSDYKRTPPPGFEGVWWATIWDGLYYNFLEQHRKMLSSSRGAQLLTALNKKGDAQESIEVGRRYLASF